MKRTIVGILLAVSLSMNVAVGATVIWNLWHARQPAAIPSVTNQQSLSKDDIQNISAAWPRNHRQEIRKIRQRIQEKKLEILEMISRNPTDLKAAEKKIDELVALRGQLEKKAITGISEIMSTLPQEKRAAFFGFLRSRACMGAGMGRGMMRGDMGRGMMGPGMGCRRGR